MISSTDCQTASFCVQRSWEFLNEEHWANDQFFESYEKAELYIIQMQPFWDRREKARIVPTSELSNPKGWDKVFV